MEKILIQYFSKDAPVVEKIDEGSWIDLYLAEDTTLFSGQRAYLPLGVAMQLPEGYEAIMAPRSSTYARWGLLQTNSIAVIDSSFHGPEDEWKMPVLATRNVKIPKGTRLCQFRIQKEQPYIVFVPVDRLENDNREGLGHTGA